MLSLIPLDSDRCSLPHIPLGAEGTSVPRCCLHPSAEDDQAAGETEQDACLFFTRHRWVLMKKGSSILNCGSRTGTAEGPNVIHGRQRLAKKQDSW